jgi:glycerate 2-kinase
VDLAHRRQHALQIARAALRAVDGEALVARWLQANPVQACQIAAAGKVAAPMARAAAAALGERLRGGLVVVPGGYDSEVPAPLQVRVTAHPLPDERSVEAGREMLALVSRSKDTWLGLWSGGASAALELPRPGVSLQQLREVTSGSMFRGEDITTLNRRRGELSQLKQGALARAGGTWQNLVLSDVPGDDPALVGSGPAVLPGDGTVVLAGLPQALEAARAEAFALRYATVVLDAELSGEAALAGQRLAVAVRATAGGPPMALLLAGEPTVSGVPDGAVGGRMQELALAAALALDGLPAVVLALATDGRDGRSPPGTCGALVDGQTAARWRERGVAAAGALASHESYRALQQADALLQLGPTRSNVRDLVVALTGPALTR